MRQRWHASSRRGARASSGPTPRCCNRSHARHAPRTHANMLRLSCHGRAAMPDTLLRFDHLALPVYDAARTYHFYSEVLQLPLVDALSGDDWEASPWLMMFFGTGSGQLLALCALRG